jgi:hypothetical protein
MSGLAIAFGDEASFAAAMVRLRASGFERIEAFTPYPVAALDTVVLRPMVALPVAVFLAGWLGLGLGFLMQWYGAAVAYPLNIGGRPYASWPAFLPIAFEIAVLCAVLTGFFGFFVLTRLPRPYRPIAAIPGFERATQDRFFVVVDQGDARFNPVVVCALVAEFAPCSIVDWRS